MPTFDELKAKCLKDKKLFEDLDFPARNKSIQPDCDTSNPADWLWKRPGEISDCPQFIVDGASRFDLIQGELGDCWFIAACAVLATKPEIFSKVVPSEQNFVTDYAGIFKFNFWRFGEWIEVYVDDRLPVTIDKTLRFGQNRSEPNEYWGALLEKAYAKLNGTYQAIQAGHVKDALVDMTGGISEDFNLRREEKLPPDLFEILLNSHKMGSLMGCGIWGDPGSMTEELMWNGLYKGHAYSITGVLQTRICGWPVQLIRLRNPWGQKEWSGAWSDGSEEWKSLNEEDKKEIGLAFDDDGEFWMSMKDFISNFHGLDIVHLGPESFARVDKNGNGYEWNKVGYHGRWIKGVTAGGSGYLADPTTRLYYTNPQYSFKLRDADDEDVGGDCICIISLLQKDYRKRKIQKGTKLLIGFDIHQVKAAIDEPLLPDTYFDKAQLKKQHQTRTPLREVSCRLLLSPGTYCVIPNTMRPNQEGEFLLRIYTRSRIHAKELDENTKTSEYERIRQPEEKPLSTAFSNDMFMAYAGEDHGVDARDLRDMLGELARREFGENLSFGIESCRSLIAMLDKDGSGLLDYDETLNLWDEVLYWRTIFKKYDKDKSGCIETYELRSILKDIGFKLSLDTISSLVVRYGGKDRNLFFEDFVLCLARTMTLYSAFKQYSQESPGQARLNLDEWLKTMLYL